MKSKLKKVLSRKKHAEKPAETSPRVTNETLAAHREEVLGQARKFIYPLQHSKHRLVTISISLLLVAVVAFSSYCVFALYKTKSDSKFLYRVTQVIPFPVARIGSDFVAYENYLFEINHYTHYYRVQQKLDFNSEAGKQQLQEFKKTALSKVINDAYVKKIASERGIRVTEQELNNEIAVVRNQNRLGSSDKEFEAVLKDFWNWSVDDFRRSLRQQLLNDKVIVALDTDAKSKADSALSKLSTGADFSALAKEVSEDPATKQNGGDFGFAIDKNNRDISPKTVEVLFKLKPGETSDIINIGYGLEIVKSIEQTDGKIRAAHIVFNFKDIQEYLNDVKDKQKTRTYIRL